MNLISSQSYKDATPKQRKIVGNGCGQKGFLGRFVPNTIWFLNIKEACQIHDWDYHHGKTLEDKRKADVRFYGNMKILINNAGGYEWLKTLRRERAAGYYFAVKHLGKKPFSKGKNDAR